MFELTTFNNSQFGTVRTVEIDGEPWLVGKDVAEILGFKNPRQALSSNVDDEDRGVHAVDTPSGVQNMTVINESGLLSLVLCSKLPSAKAFKHWVTKEVLPSIRKTGGYQMQKQMTPAEITLANAQAIVDHERRMNAIEDSVKSIDEKLTGVVDTFTAPTADPDVWQTETRKIVTKLVQDNKLSYQAYWADLYERLELRAGVNLETRKKRLKERLAKQGVAKHVINNVSKLLVISQDKKLVDIFNSIVREEKAKYVLLKGGRTA